MGTTFRQIFGNYIINNTFSFQSNRRLKKMSYSKKVSEDIKIKFKAIALGNNTSMTNLLIAYTHTLVIKGIRILERER